MRWSLVVLPAALVTAGVVGQVLAQEDPDVAFTPTDVRISEASGLVVREDNAFVVNDSGHEPLLFRVSTDSGDTLETIRYAQDNIDVETLAPGNRPGVVWVGDIGDNNRARSEIAVHRVRVGDADSVDTFRLSYPEGAQNAEAMVVDGRGRIFVITKDLLGGHAYTVGPRLQTNEVNPMTKVARVGQLITDAALTPDQRHVLLRSYGNLSVHTFPDFERLGSMELPDQPQGESVAVTEDGQILIHTEGIGEPVRRVELTAKLKAAMSSAPSASPAATPEEAAPQPGEEAADEDRPAWVYIGGLVGVLGLVGCAGVVLAVSAARRRSRRNG